MAQVSERAGAPTVRTSFFGRERERAHLAELLRRCPLVTLTGPGGIGKTRLVTEFLATEADPASVRWCTLTAIDEDAAVAAAVADAVGRDSASVGPERAVVDAMTERDPLLVLDNCEHVVLGVAQLVERILDECPDARVVATSREPLRVEGEAVLALGPLAVPADASPHSLAAAEAAALFLDRARLVCWDFQLDAASADHIARICRRLDGLPLALELAAARVRSLTPAEIADRLDSRFALLRRPRSRGSERHRTLRAAIDWSYELLDQPERLVFDRLSVMAGPADLEAAVAICAGDGVEREHVLDLLDGLVERSLVQSQQRDGVTRYTMLESLRDYGHERLAERGDYDCRRALHAEYFAAVADRYRRETQDTWAADMLSGALALFPEVRLAAHWSMRHEPNRERALRLVVPLWPLAHTRHATEILELCDEAYERWPVEHDPLGQELLGAAASAGFVAGRPGPALERARAAVAAEGSGAARAVTARRAIALVTYGFLGEVEAGLERLDEVIEAARAEGARTVEVEMRVLRSQALTAAGRADDGLGEATAAREDAERMESPHMLAWSVYVLGTVLAFRGDHAAALRCFDDSLRIADERGYNLVRGLSLRQLGMAALRAGREAEAAGRLAAAFDHFAETGDAPQQWDVLRAAAPLFLRVGMAERAAQIMAGADADPRARRPAPLEAAGVEALRAELGEAIESAAVAPPRLEDVGPGLLAELRAMAARAATTRARPDASAEAPVAGSPPAAPRACVFRRDGELWRLAFDGDEVHMPDLKGLHDIARLLAAPGQEFHCLELAGAPASEGRAAAAAADHNALRLQGDAGALLDERARTEYRQRIQDLREEAEQAETAHDTERAERARDELDQLTDALAKAFGLGGRARKAGDPAERARSAVTWRIRSAVGKIEAAHPALGRHLRNSIGTGTFCVYRPERPLDWVT